MKPSPDIFYVYSWDNRTHYALWDHDQAYHNYRPYMTLEYSGSLGNCRRYIESAFAQVPA